MGLFRVFSQFVKFGIVGIANTVISLGIYYGFIWADPHLYLIGYIVGFVVSVLNAYFWNNKLVFSKKENGHIKPLLKSFIAYGATFLLGVSILYLTVDFLHLSKEIAPLCNLILTVPVNFLLIKLWAFKDL